MAAKKSDDRVTKRKVTMVSGFVDPSTGENVRMLVEDFVRPDLLDAYVADARTRWQYVGVSDEPDAGPAGYEGATTIPPHLCDANGRLLPPDSFTGYGDARTPNNRLDDLLINRGDSPSYEALGTPGVFRGGSGPAPGAGGAGGGGGGGLLGPLGPFMAPMLARLGFMAALMVTVALVLGHMRLAFQTAAIRNALATYYGTQCTHAALYSTVPGGTQGTELTGGSPAYARKALTWGSPTNGAISATAVTFDVASGSTVAGGGLHSAITAGTYYDGASLTSQAFASQGTYQLTASCTVT